MTRISFYILSGSSENYRQIFACRLAEKAYKQGNDIYIHTENAAQTEQLDAALWSFRADSFLPHQLFCDHAPGDAPILISHTATKLPRLMDLLINFSVDQPQFFSQFKRVVELINDNNQIKENGRMRYHFYKQHGYTLDTFNIKNNGVQQ